MLIGWHEWNESAGKNCGIAMGALADSESTLLVGVLALTGLDVGVNEGRMSPNALVNCVSLESGLRVNDKWYMLFLASSTISVFIPRRPRLSFLHEHLQKVVAQ